jgi:hypothetical protein
MPHKHRLTESFMQKLKAPDPSHLELKYASL